LTRVHPGDVIAVVTHARDVPAVERARFRTKLDHAFAGRALVLETCHRVEAYLATEDELASVTLRAELPSGGRWLAGEDAIRHAVTVAVGIDSVVVGEDQILHQLRATVDTARSRGALDPALERLFALALQAGRRARSWRPGPRRSLADVAVSAIARLGGDVRGREILVVGAGGMGRLSVRAALAAGASVAVANRRSDAAESLAALTGARVEQFDPGSRVGAYEAVIVAIAGPWAVGRPVLEALGSGRTIVVDLSVPAAVPPDLADLLGARLVTADALAGGGAGAGERGGPARDAPGRGQDAASVRTEALVERTVAEFLEWRARAGGRSAAEALLLHADREREVELAALWRRLPDLEPDVRDAIEGMTRHFAGRLLRAPLQRLGRDSDGTDGRTVRDLFAL
jgi:glutamyl-tRNA reductase